MIKLENIGKKFNRRVLFANFTFIVKNPGLYAIYGDNGSGKTTLLKLLAGKEKPTNGTAEITGSICYVDSLYPVFSELTVYDNLKLICPDDTKIKDGIKKFDLRMNLTQKAKACSKGEKARIALLRAILMDSEIILLDEPLANLDMQTADLIYRNLKRLSADRIIFFTTNYEEDLKLCDCILKIEKQAINIRSFEDIKENREIPQKTAQTISYDRKILSRLAWSRGSAFMYWAEILIFCVICIFAGLVSYDKKAILSSQYSYTEMNYKIVINAEAEEDEVITAEQKAMIEQTFSPAVVWQDSSYFKLAAELDDSSSLADCFYYPTLSQGGIKTIVSASSRFELQDNEIAVSDYIYALFQQFSLLNQDTVRLNGIEYRIKEIYPTSYLHDYEAYTAKVNTSIAQRHAVSFYSKHEAIKKRLSEYYSKIYISEAMAEKLKLRSLEQIKINGFAVKYLNSLKENEIILPQGFAVNFKVNDSYWIADDVYGGVYKIVEITNEDIISFGTEKCEQVLKDYSPVKEVLYEIAFQQTDSVNRRLAKSSLLYYEEGMDTALIQLNRQETLYPVFQIIFSSLLLVFGLLIILRLIVQFLKEKEVFILCHNLRVSPKKLVLSFMRRYALTIFPAELLLLVTGFISSAFILEEIYQILFIPYNFMLYAVMASVLLWVINSLSYFLLQRYTSRRL